jgi:glycosyltransferase involved in cell wall biosynthesis
MNRLAIVSSHPIQYLAPVYRALARRIELDVYYAYRPDAVAQGAEGFGVPFEWDCDLLSGYRHIFLKNVAKEPAVSRFGGCDTPELPTLLAEGRYDAVLVVGWHLKCFWQAILWCRARGVPVMVRGDSQLESPRRTIVVTAKRLLYPLGLRAFSAVLYVGQRSRAYFEAYGFPQDRMFFSPHGVDADWFASRAGAEARSRLRSRLGVGEGERLLLFAGKLVEFKRPLDVVRAAGRLRRAGAPASVLVAGEGPLAEAVRREAAEQGTPLHMLGFLNQSEIPAAYAAADVLALPSDGRETWGLVANEALTCGTPIVVSDATGCSPDLAGDGGVGRIYPMGDVARLAGAIEDLFRRPPTPAQFASKLDTYGVTAAAEGMLAAAHRCAAA